MNYVKGIDDNYEVNTVKSRRKLIQSEIDLF